MWKLYRDTATDIGKPDMEKKNQLAVGSWQAPPLAVVPQPVKQGEQAVIMLKGNPVSNFAVYNQAGEMVRQQDGYTWDTGNKGGIPVKTGLYYIQYKGIVHKLVVVR